MLRIFSFLPYINLHVYTVFKEGSGDIYIYVEVLQQQ